MTLLVGALVGWLASIIMKTNDQMGAIANILVGIVGAMLGSWIAGMLGVVAAGSLVSLAISLGGAVLLIFLLTRVGVFKKGRV
ncbi:MAG: GlsB/YeaQ/YmgE family stress response membrane protein [Gemmatimonadota bacterium]|nr:GlsB/YeaQ/YmgE family stress response membrane protein [Gemmatimonadota bacterium]